MDDFQIDRIRQDVTESLNYRQNYRRQLSMNDPFIFEGYTLYLQFQMKHSGYLNPSEETGTGCPVTSKYGKTPPNKYGGVGRQQQQECSEVFNHSGSKML